MVPAERVLILTNATLVPAIAELCVPHNRLLLALAHSFGHRITKFGNPDFCGAGPLKLS